MRWRCAKTTVGSFFNQCQIRINHPQIWTKKRLEFLCCLGRFQNEKRRRFADLRNFGLWRAAGYLGGRPARQGTSLQSPGGFGRVFKIDGQAYNASISAYYNAVRPDNTADWQLRVQFALLFPK